MSLTRTQIESWNPATLTEIGDAWIALGTKVEDLFTRYVDGVTRVNDAYWEGKTAEAAQNRANADKKTALVVVDQLEALANRAKQGFHDVDAPLQRARMAIVAAESAGFRVADDLTVTDPGTPDPDNDRLNEMTGWQRDITDAASATETADATVRDAFASARDGLRATFTSAAALGSDQGASDGTQLVSDPAGLNPEQIQRLTEAGELTPEQLDAVNSGNAATIPASQMEYLNQVSRSLDGKSPQEIQQIMDKLPPDSARALANSLQIVSNDKITATVKGDSQVPTTGGLNLLPDKMVESLTRDDLVTRDFKMVGATGASSVELHGVADNQAIAEIVQAGDAQYKNGSSLDQHLLDVGRQYLDAQVAHEQNPNHKFEYFTVDGRGTEDTAITEGIFTAVGDDKIAVQNAVTQPDTGQNLVRDILTHNWSDNGQAAASMFRFDDADATVEDPNNPADVEAATRSGQIMSAVAENMSADWDTLRGIPGSGGQSVGEVNPDLLRTMSHSMSPYISDLAGAGRSENPGFDIGTWADPSDNNHFGGSSNVFAVMNTDPEAGTHFTQSSMQEILAAEGRYAHDPAAPLAGGDLSTAGRIHGLMDRGLLLSTEDSYSDKAEQAQAIYDRKAAAYGALTSIGSVGLDRLPGGEFINTMIDAGGDPLQDAVIGKAPGPAPSVALEAPDFYRDYYNILQATPELPANFRQEYSWAFDESGNLLSWDDVRSNPNLDLRSKDGYQDMFNHLGDPADGNGERIRNGYDDVVRNDG
ncbi:hypothetical protein Rhow_003201 [Rhodococcus wratislaviensis]|uniref:TPR repeat domain-containing protein n=1 Tax=Rhodococcus wratislaviensis TaxID=44752 RepID=A0A402C832_RHOWR|nr:hypothetical protein [Rhodococcus wratislaviensis]GCE39677.1 hypothetical protein Rhow_003201 [Rhodococcus wratislaviensis]